jgi:hypothetical protein
MSRADAVVAAASAFLDALMPVLREECRGDDQPLELAGFTRWVAEPEMIPGVRFYKAASTWLTAEHQCAARVLGELREPSSSGMNELTRLDRALADDPVIGPRISASSVSSFGAGGGAMQGPSTILLLVDRAVSEAGGFDLAPASRDELVAR